MGAVKVNNDEVWNDYVKTGKVKGFSIEGYFADKMERPKESIKEDMSEKQADLLLSEIEKIVKGEKVELALVDDLKKLNNSYLSDTDTANSKIKGLLSDARSIESKIESALKNVSKIKSAISKIEQSAKDLGIKTSNIKELETANVILKDSNDYKQILSSLKKLITTI
jgi:hypothetical protein